MDKKEILAKLNEIFQEIFDDETLIITESTTAQDIEDWDSFAHINLMAVIEQSFQVKFTMEEAFGMKNVGEMIDAIDRHI